MALWNARPFDQKGDNPFGRKTEESSFETLSADSSKCPSCGSNIFFEPELGAMMCRDCGNVYSPDTMEPRGSLGISKEHDYVGDTDMSEADKMRHEIVCNACGAALVADENTMSTMCPFCGSPALITRRLTREFKPDYIVPFKIDKDQAESIMNKWIASRKHTPLGFKTKSRLTKMTALYVPFWLVDCGVNSDVSGTGKKIDGITTTIFEVDSKITYFVKGVPFDASIKVANKLMEAIEPFDYSEMVRFESKYLQGFYADKYDQLPSEITDRITRRLNRFSDSELEVIARRYDEYENRSIKNFTWLSDISVRYCLLPVWFMTVEFGGTKYQFAVNGQTGEAAGRVPTSRAADIVDWLTFRMRGLWAFIPILAMILCMLIFGAIVAVKDGANLSPVMAFLWGVANVLQYSWIFVAMFASLWLIFSILIKAGVLQRLFSRKETAYEANDYDADPGLDAYFDHARHSDVKVKENFLRHIVKVVDENGRVVGERSIEA